MKNTVKLGLFALIMASAGSIIAMERIPTAAELDNQKAYFRKQLDNLSEGLKLHKDDFARIWNIRLSANSIANQAQMHPDIARQARDIARTADGILQPRMQATGPGAGPRRQLFPPASPTTATAAAAATMAPAAPAPTIAPPPADPMDED